METKVNVKEWRKLKVGGPSIIYSGKCFDSCTSTRQREHVKDVKRYSLDTIVAEKEGEESTVMVTRTK